MGWLGSYGSTGQFCCTWCWQELHPPGGWLARVATSGHLAETAGRLASAGMGGPLFSPSPSRGLHSRITLLSTCRLSSPKCKGRSFQAFIKTQAHNWHIFSFASPCLWKWVTGPVHIHCGKSDYVRAWILGGMVDWGLSLEINYYIDQYILLLEFQIYSTPLPHF